MTNTTRYAYCIDCEWTGGEGVLAWTTSGLYKWRRCPKCRSGRVEVKSNSEIVAAIAAQLQDEAVRERVIHDLRSAVDDYAFAVGLAGDLGGVEIL